MVKKISTLALAGLLALPALASAGAGGAAATSDMQAQVDALTKQLNAIKAQMADIKSTQDQKFEAFDAKADKWDMASRIQFSGDFRARGDYYSADTKAYVPMMVPHAATGAYVFNTPALSGYPGVYTAPESQKDNDTIFTNRFRLDMRAKALENVEFKGRLAMYKTWGEQTNASGLGNMNGFPLDSVAAREPKDSILRVDRAFVNWNAIGGSPMWFSVGRRPTTDGPPNQLRLGMDERMATPTAVMDWPFDGVSVGYAYNNLFGVNDAPGRVRICWGRGFEDGVTSDTTNNIDDTDFAGLSWDIYKKGNRFAYLQSFAAVGVFNYPRSADGSMEYAMGMLGLLQTGGDPADYTPAQVMAMGNAGRENIGNIYHTSGVYQDKWENLNYFGLLGWSRTDPDGGGQGMLGSTTDDKDGYIVHVGARYDIPNSLFKVGAEYNHGSKNWVSMTPGHDDMYASKLATRGNVYEVYGIYDIPGGEAISKYGKAWMRLGYQHYDYDYTGSGDWNAAPIDIDNGDLLNPANMQMSAPVETANQVYLTFEAAF